MSRDHTEYYEDKRGKWRWRTWSTNGRIIGASSQGYVTKRDAKDNVQQLFMAHRWGRR